MTEDNQTLPYKSVNQGRSLESVPALQPCGPATGPKILRTPENAKKYEKKIPKNGKIPDSGLSPEKKKKKHRKNTKLILSGPFWYLGGGFFSYFWRPTRGGGFSFIFSLFFVFCHGFWALWEARRIAIPVAHDPYSGARLLRGRTATQRSKKGSLGVLSATLILSKNSCVLENLG